MSRNCSWDDYDPEPKEPRYEVIVFQRNGKTWFSVKDFLLEEVYTLSFDEWLAHCERFKKEGLRHGSQERP